MLKQETSIGQGDAGSVTRGSTSGLICLSFSQAALLGRVQLSAERVLFGLCNMILPPGASSMHCIRGSSNVPCNPLACKQSPLQRDDNLCMMYTSIHDKRCGADSVRAPQHDQLKVHGSHDAWHAVSSACLGCSTASCRSAPYFCTLAYCHKGDVLRTRSQPLVNVMTTLEMSSHSLSPLTTTSSPKSTCGPQSVFLQGSYVVGVWSRPECMGCVLLSRKCCEGSGS